MSGGRIVGMLCLLAPLLSGCGGSAAPKTGQDPLVGLNAPPIPKEVTPTAKGPLQPVPALTAPSAATSPAALATGAVPTLESDREMRIPSGSDPAAAWRGQSPTGVTLSHPVASHDSGPERSLTPVPAVGPLAPASGSSAATGSIDQMMHFLEGRGVKGFRLEMSRETGQWRCTCSIPERENPSYKHTYDTQETAATDPQSALRAVVEKIEREGH